MTDAPPRDLPDKALIKRWWLDLADTSDGTNPICRLRSMLSACAIDTTRTLGPEKAAVLLTVELGFALESARLTHEQVKAACAAAETPADPKRRAVH